MLKEESKKTIKIFIAVYTISFVFVNWNDVSWLFNYRALFGMVDEFFTPYPSATSAVSADNAVIFNTQNNGVAQNIKAGYTDKENSIEIPSIRIFAPIIIPRYADKNSISKDLENGVVYYPGSVLPGQNGQIVVLGHSSPLNWPKIKYDWVFSNINNLDDGDQIIVNLENKRYVYIVNEKRIIKKGEEISFRQYKENFNSLILVSCWPPGKDTQRIAVESSLSINLTEE